VNFSILGLLWVWLRLALSIAPFPLLYFRFGPVTQEVIQSYHLLLFAPVWTLVSLFVLFFREMVAATPSGPVTASHPHPAGDDNKSDDFDWLTPGTAEFNVQNYGGVLDQINGDTRH